MRDFLVVGGLTGTILLATAGIVTVINRPVPPESPTDTSPRILAAEPQFYDGRKVRVSVEGFQPDGPNRLVFRRRAELPPVVVCTFIKPVPVGLSGKFTGRVKIVDDVPHLTDCVPE